MTSVLIHAMVVNARRTQPAVRPPRWFPAEQCYKGKQWVLELTGEVLTLSQDCYGPDLLFVGGQKSTTDLCVPLVEEAEDFSGSDFRPGAHWKHIKIGTVRSLRGVSDDRHLLFTPWLRPYARSHFRPVRNRQYQATPLWTGW